MAKDPSLRSGRQRNYELLNFNVACCSGCFNSAGVLFWSVNIDIGTTFADSADVGCFAAKSGSGDCFKFF